MSAPPFPFQASMEELERHLDMYVRSIIRSLRSEFMVLPKGPNFIEYPVFEQAYEELKKATQGFQRLHPPEILEACVRTPLALIVLRTILGFSPGEWAEATRQLWVRRGEAPDRAGPEDMEIGEGFVRGLEQRIKRKPLQAMRLQPATRARVLALIETACRLIQEGAPDLEGRIHRLDKADTKGGLASLQATSLMGLPYPMLLYERFLGRPFASHRDAVSKLIGQSLEQPIEDLLTRHGISYRKTSRLDRSLKEALRLPQVPDFVIPDEFNRRVVIEAKLAEDGGTARDKIARILELAAVPDVEVIACIDGRGFTREKDIKKLLLALKGKVFTLSTLNYMVDHTSLREFKSREG